MLYWRLDFERFSVGVLDRGLKWRTCESGFQVRSSEMKRLPIHRLPTTSASFTFFCFDVPHPPQHRTVPGVADRLGNEPGSMNTAKGRRLPARRDTTPASAWPAPKD